MKPHSSFTRDNDTRMHPPSVQAMIESQIANHIASQASHGCKDNGTDDEILSTASVFGLQTPSKTTSSKTRSLSDSTPTLSPSPNFRERLKESKDDQTILSGPTTPRRPDALSRGLSLQMPTKELGPHNALSYSNRIPLSPKLDSHNTYATPASVLPRRSRGVEFSRQATNLHHSTLAEQSSPDSSPTITQKGMMIPLRKGHLTSLSLDSPHFGSQWSAMGSGDRTAASSSVGSINMLGSESSSSSSDELDPMDPDDNDDPMIMTPQAMRSTHALGSGQFGGPVPSPSGWPNMFSPAGPSFMSIQRARLRKGRSRKSSSSASGNSNMPSPGPASPPHSKALEHGNGGYFAREAVMRNAGSRRESLTMVTGDLHISSGNDSGDEAPGGAGPATPSVVRRVVSRRGNLFPKSKAFGRIRADLLEESTPIESEVRREAEIIRQVRDGDTDYDRSTTAHSSPALLPIVPGLSDGLSDIPEDNTMGLDSSSSSTKGLLAAFSLQPTKGLGLSSQSPWSMSESQAHTPPPTIFPRGSYSRMSDDISMDSPIVSSSSISTSLPQAFESISSSLPRASTPQPFLPPTAADGLKKSNKRRRDDDLDVTSLKRRAVSPGVSVQNSPILSQSPAQRDVWGAQKHNREGSGSGTGTGERSNNGGTLPNMTPTMGPKRIGLQGMTDTNDSLMKMSIE